MWRLLTALLPTPLFVLKGCGQFGGQGGAAEGQVEAFVADAFVVDDPESVRTGRLAR